jgi:hypothetical protein
MLRRPGEGSGFEWTCLRLALTRLGIVGGTLEARALPTVAIWTRAFPEAFSLRSFRLLNKKDKLQNEPISKMSQPIENK